MIRPKQFLAVFALFCAFAAILPAQSIYATLTGVVSDPSQGLVAQATVRLRDEASGSLRDTTTNNQGYYTFASVPVGTYELTVTLAGFESYKESGVALGGGEKRNVNVDLKVGSATETVMVTGTADLDQKSVVSVRTVAHSRRRGRWLSDWSSDVCSSDLSRLAAARSAM